MTTRNGPEIPETMTPEFVKEYLAFIEEISGDDERAHIMEDNIYFAVIKAIAEGRCENITQCCVEVIKCEDIEFSRWHA